MGEMGMMSRGPGGRGLRSAAVVLGLVLLAGAGSPAVLTAAAAPGPATGARQPQARDTATAAQPVRDSQDAARAQAAQTGKDVEVTSLRTESSETFVTAAGHMQVVQHLRPVRTRVDGRWRALDTSLEKRADGSVGPRTATVGVSFSGGGVARPLITLERAGRKLSYSWPTALPVPVLDGDTATYAEVLPGVDLRVRAEAEGASEVLVVKDASAAANPELARLKLAVSSSGLSVAGTPDGGLRAVDTSSGGTVFEAPKPLMWDSGAVASAPKSLATGGGPAAGPAHEPAAGPASGPVADPANGPADSARVAPIGLSVEEHGSRLVLTPDQNLLKTAHYPLYIDPETTTPKASGWTMASRYWASSPQWKFNGDPDAGMGYCSGDSRCAPEDVKRLFYQVSTAAFAGKSIISAEFIAHETHSYSCSARNVEVWRTKAINSSTTWNTQLASGFWIDRLQTVSAAHGWSSDCAAGDIEFQVLRAVQQAAANDWSSTTFGLKASDEGDPTAWKRFSDDAFLRVEYDLPPRQISMSQLTSNPGGACGKPGAGKYVRSLPTLMANNVTDPDGGGSDGDRVAVQFAANWDTGDGKGMVPRWVSPLSAYKASGSDFPLTLPSNIPKNKVIAWYARSYDSAQYSPWSYDGSATTCSVIYDTSVPAGPAISSLQYPQSDPADPADPWTDGVGRYGSFTIDSPTTDVVKYWFGINGDPTSAHSLTTSGGGAASVKFMPTKPGINYITAQAFDTAGNGSEIRTYQFRVRAGQPERLSLGLNEPAGAASVSGTGGDWRADLHGGATTGGEGVAGTGVHLDGVDGYASTVSPVLNTGKSFSVSVWAKLPAQEPTHPVMALSQNGSYASGFQLLYSPAGGGWVFARFSSDNAAGSGYYRAAQPACPAGDTACKAARLGTWTHVVGLFDNTSQQIRLYVNGALAGATPSVTPWDARGQTLIGASAQNGTLGSFFTGDLDQAQFFDYQLTDAQIGVLAAQQAVGTGRPAKAVWSFDESSGVPSVTGRAQQVNARLNGGTKTGQPGVSGTGLSFDGVDDDAVTTQPVLDTYQSFAVSLWARIPDENRTSVAVHQAGVNNRGFEIYHNATGWVFQRAVSDTVGATLARAQQTACPSGPFDCAGARLGDWTHIVAVNDFDLGQMLLYVDGRPVASAPFTTPWLATGPITLGASNYPSGLSNFFKGDLDDVHLFDRALSPDEVTTLFKQNPVVKGRWQLDSAAGTPATSADASGGNHPVTLVNGASIGSGWVDSGALNLDGVDDYAATSGVPIDTSRSFTVSAWAVSAGTRPTKDQALISQEGTTTSAYSVRYVASTGRWQIVMPGADSASAATSTADNALYDADGANGWNHLALVYDAFAGEMRLYVNGQLQQTVCDDTDGDGTQDDPACTDRVSWASNSIGFNAVKSLQLGRAKTNGVWGQNWSGAIDDVWAFQGVLTQTQVQALANGQSGLPTTVPGLG